MTTATYELWDTDTGNIVGSFDSRDAGLDVVRVLLDAYGRAYANDLVLTACEGEASSRVVATGNELAELVDRQVALRAQIA